MIPPGFVSISKAYSKLFQRHGSEVFGRLEFLLNTEKLQAFWFDRQGGEHRLSGALWQGMNDSGRLDIFNTGEAIIGSYKTVAKIVIRKNDLATLFPSENTATSVDTTEAGSATKRGRPPKYNWDAIWAGIVLIVHEKGWPESQDEMIGWVQQWHAKSFGKDTEPSRPTLQLRIKQLFALRDGKEPSIVFQSPSKAKNRAVKTRIKSTR